MDLLHPPKKASRFQNYVCTKIMCYNCFKQLNITIYVVNVNIIIKFKICLVKMISKLYGEFLPNTAMIKITLALCVGSRMICLVSYNNDDEKKTWIITKETTFNLQYTKLSSRRLHKKLENPPAHCV